MQETQLNRPDAIAEAKNKKTKKQKNKKTRQHTVM